MDTKVRAPGTYPALEGVRGAGRAAAPGIAGCSWPQSGRSPGASREDGQLQVATVGDVGAELLIVRGFVGLLVLFGPRGPWSRSPSGRGPVADSPSGRASGAGTSGWLQPDGLPIRTLSH